MVRRSRKSPANLPAWRVVGAALAAFAMGVQLVLAGWLISQSAAAAGPDLLVICSHGASPASGGGDGGSPVAPGSHGQCAVCACLQSAKVLAQPPEAPRFVVLRQRAEAVPSFAVLFVHFLHVHSPYASRAPPPSA
jgi:hypothetical protein